MPHGGWHGGHHAGGVASTKSGFRASIRCKAYTGSKSFQTRADAELWLKRKSDENGLTRNQVRICTSDSSSFIGGTVMEMRLSGGAVIEFKALFYPIFKPHKWYNRKGIVFTKHLYGRRQNHTIESVLHDVFVACGAADDFTFSYWVAY